MAFTLTKYIFPIPLPINLSSTLGFVLDNPRNSSEIELVETFLKRSLEIDLPSNAESLNVLFHFRHGVNVLQEVFRQRGTENYFVSFYDSERDLLKSLAKSWIIIRFPDNDKEFIRYSENTKLLIADTLDLELSALDPELPRRNSYFEGFYLLQDYCAVLSILCNDGFVRGATLSLLNYPTELFLKCDRRQLYEEINAFTEYCITQEQKDKIHYWGFWYTGRDEIIKKSQLIENEISKKIVAPDNKNVPLSQEQSPLEKVLYVGSMLRTIFGQVKNPRIRLVLLVSIIEYMLVQDTYSPKATTKHGLKKQFKNKGTKVIISEGTYTNEPEVMDSLDRIYQYRSEIAHANYIHDENIKALNKYIFLMSDYVKILIKMYLLDRPLIDKLKDS